MSLIPSSTLKTGQRPQLRQEKSYKPGEDLFVEGEKGNEMFMIDEGEVAILKKSEEALIPLAKLGPGASIGEMALLDDMPRSATVRALTPTKVTVINRLAFNAVLEKVPLWMRSIVKIITSRLRDANTRVGKCMLRDLECGLTVLLNSMLERYGRRQGDSFVCSYNLVKNLCMFTTRMTSKNFLATVEALKRRNLLALDKDSDGHPLIAVKDPGALRLFEDYRKLKGQGKKMIGADLTPAHHEFLSNISYVSQKNAIQTADGIFLPWTAVDFGDEKENRRLLSDLEKKGVLSSALPGQYGDSEGLLYDRKTFERVRKLKGWIAAFELAVIDPGKA